MNNLIILFKVNYICLAGLGMAHGSHFGLFAGIIDIWQEAASETNLQSNAIFLRVQWVKSYRLNHGEDGGATSPPRLVWRYKTTDVAK